jgi:hypothetical protein
VLLRRHTQVNEPSHWPATIRVVPRIAVLANVCGAIAVTTAVLVAHGVTDARRPSAAGVVTKSVLRAGDAVNGYRLVRTPDGIDAFDNGDGTFTLLVRDHSIVSRWVISADDFTLLDGRREPLADVDAFSKDIDASGFLGDGWRLRIEVGRVVAVRLPEAADR